MTLSTKSEPRSVIRDALFAHEVLRRLDIPPDDIFFAVNRHGSSLDCLDVSVVVRTAGKEWVWNMAVIEAPLGIEPEAEALVKEWTAAVEFWNTCDPGIDLWGFSKSRVLRMGLMAATSLHAKGIRCTPLGEALDTLERERNRGRN